MSNIEDELALFDKVEQEIMNNIVKKQKKNLTTETNAAKAFFFESQIISSQPKEYSALPSSVVPAVLPDKQMFPWMPPTGIPNTVPYDNIDDTGPTMVLNSDLILVQNKINADRLAIRRAESAVSNALVLEKIAGCSQTLRHAGGKTWEDNSLSEWIADDFRIFVGDLGNDVSDDLLTRMFQHYTSFQKAKVIRDKRSGKTRGYGFVSFSDPKDYVTAMRELNGKYCGSRPMKLMKSKWEQRIHKKGAANKKSRKIVK